jgi:hypothetical protein
MKIIFGSFRNATRDVKLADSTIGRKGAATIAMMDFCTLVFMRKRRA